MMTERSEHNEKFRKTRLLCDFLDDSSEEIRDESLAAINEELQKAGVDPQAVKAKLFQAFNQIKSDTEAEPQEQPQPGLDPLTRLWKALFPLPAFQMRMVTLGLIVFVLVVVVVRTQPSIDQLPRYRGLPSVGWPNEVLQPISNIEAQTDLHLRVEKLFADQHYAEAIPYAQQVLEQTRREYGAEHIDTATAMNNLAVLYRKTGSYPQAEKLYRQALPIQEKWLGETHHQTLATLSNLAKLYEESNNVVQAIEAYEKILTVQEQALGSRHPLTKQTRQHIETLRAKINR